LGAQALEALTGITASNDQITAEAEAGFASQMRGLMAGATRAFAELTSKHVTQCQTTSAQGVQTLQDAVAKFEEALGTIGTKVDEAIAKSLEELDQQLSGDLAKLDAKIQWEAHKAAKKEQPAWKSVVAIVRSEERRVGKESRGGWSR